MGDRKILILTTFLFILLTGLTYVAFLSAKNRTPNIVLPGGVTYLGPSPTQQATSDKIQIADNAKWTTQIGKKYPYSFLFPETLSLGVFPNDPFDAVGIYWNNLDASANLLLRVETISQGVGVKEYATTWWKQYSWKGVADVLEFTNKNGLKGYRAKYINEKGETPYDNVFIEVPGRRDLVIWMASGLLEPAIFDKIVDSVSWKTTP